MMTIKYGLQFFFFELTDNDGQNFLVGIVPTQKALRKKDSAGMSGKTLKFFTECKGGHF
jgi:hypothetical protein